MTETLANGYSSESTRQELSNEYQHDRVSTDYEKERWINYLCRLDLEVDWDSTLLLLPAAPRGGRHGTERHDRTWQLASASRLLQVLHLRGDVGGASRRRELPVYY